MFRARSLRAIGIAWFRQEDYAAALRMFDDADKLPADWEDWFRKAQAVEQKFVRDGFLVERAYIDPDSFPAWCAVRGLNIDAKARVRVANEVASRKYGNAH